MCVYIYIYTRVGDVCLYLYIYMCVVCRQSERQRACSSYKVLCVLEVYHVLFVCLVCCFVSVCMCVVCIYMCVMCVYIYIHIYICGVQGIWTPVRHSRCTKYTYSYIHIHKRREWFAFFSGCCCCCMFVHVCVCFCVFIVATRANYWDGRFVSLIRACRT